tara:strand:- start:76 stop:1332 length:1257 start_codon:yes stop_codon:yes gene_type:complete
MASSYVNDLRLNELGTGDGSGTWGTTTNTNLELIGEALSFGTEGITTNADTHTTTVADGASDAGRAMYIKYTGTLDSACTITIGPNTMSRVHFIENGTSGSQNIIISQGSGANITIPPGDVKVVYLDGEGSGAAVFDAFASLSVVDLKVQDDLTVGDDIIINSDSSLISLGADADATLTHDGTTGLTIAATPISIDSTGELHLNSTTGDIKLQDGGVDQIAFDLDGAAGVVTMKPAVDADDLVIAQFDGTEVIRIEDNASLGLVGNKLNISDSSSDVVIKPLTDAKDIIFQQFDGTAVMTVEDNISLAINNDITVAGRASGHVTEDNDGNFNLTVGNDFKCTTAGNLALTFSNPAAGQSGNVMFINASNHVITAHASVAIAPASLSAISSSGTYLLTYYCSAASGNNTILVSASAALT